MAPRGLGVRGAGCRVLLGAGMGAAGGCGALVVAAVLGVALAAAVTDGRRSRGGGGTSARGCRGVKGGVGTSARAVH